MTRKQVEALNKLHSMISEVVNFHCESLDCEECPMYDEDNCIVNRLLNMELEYINKENE